MVFLLSLRAMMEAATSIGGYLCKLDSNLDFGNKQMCNLEQSLEITASLSESEL